MKTANKKPVPQDDEPINTDFDNLGIGALTEKEMNYLLENTRIKMKDQELLAVAAQIDKINYDPRDFNDFFIQIAQSKKKNKEILPKVIESFKLFDYQKNGKIGVDVIKSLLKSFGEKMKPEEIDAIIQNLDDVEDNQVDYQSLVNTLFKGF